MAGRAASQSAPSEAGGPPAAQAAPEAFEVASPGRVPEPAPVSRIAEALPTPSVYVPRGAEEWQGMRIRPGDDWPCADTCSLARACIDGRCVACVDDASCGVGERCVLDHCVREEKVECVRAADCAEPEAKCVLTGITARDPRGNAEMQAVCLTPWGGSSGSSS